ncbi:glycerol-3-phosphate 1-O-acyltransferase PlsY [Tundrisphaera sp. TA3]|uniref:glycerol-3-phosphate 1-O-acyltransferase PlsY n=1 Tax=Tundrisphaera sp. TA3 TaxID=3435775 RepID=UPI003EC13B89
MNGAAATILTLGLAYLIGSIPFGLLIARRFGGIDIRTVGSGNIGATNVGRTLGLRFFFAVFLLDFLKGLLPTLALPGLGIRMSGLPLPHLPVGVAVATILGHNFPLYLRFRGGKGVATSLGAVTALDAWASLAAASGFAAMLGVTQYISVSSITGGLLFVLVHFLRVEGPWHRDHIAMSVATIGLMGLLIARHRTNFTRLARGTEPKVKFGKKNRDRHPSGRIATILIVLLATGGGATALALNASRKAEVVAGDFRLTIADRTVTGHQRAERLAFADGGKVLIATCPRYGRVLVYAITEGRTLSLARDIVLEGRPVAICPAADRFYVLIRPKDDARHVEVGWWETFDFAGEPIGSKVRLDFYPDDLVVSPDGRRVMVLSSGRGEGGDHRPMPALTVFQIDASAAAAPARLAGRLEFDRPGDDPAHLALAPDGVKAAVSLQGSNQVAWIDLADADRPALIARCDWPEESRPDVLRFDRQGGLLAVDDGREALWHQDGPAASPEIRPIDGGIGDALELTGTTDFWACTLPFGSGLALVPVRDASEEPAVLPLKGTANLSSTRPMGLAHSPERSLMAVANRSGGSIHLIAIERE